MSDLDTTEQDAAEVRRLFLAGDAFLLTHRFNFPKAKAQQIMYPQTLARRLTKLNRYLDEVGA